MTKEGLYKAGLAMALPFLMPILHIGVYLFGQKPSSSAFLLSLNFREQNSIYLSHIETGIEGGLFEGNGA